MTSFGSENYVNYKYSTEMPQWMKNERMEYCEQTSVRKLRAHHIFAQILFSIFF